MNSCQILATEAGLLFRKLLSWFFLLWILCKKMIENIQINEKSLFYGVDPRVKIVFTAIFSIVMAVCSSWAALVSGLFLAIVLMVFSGLSPVRTLIRLITLNGLMLFFWIFLPFSIDGTSLFTLGPLTASREGVAFAGVLTLRSNIIILVCLCLASTTSIFTLGFALQQLHCPEKIVQLFLFTYRYLHVIFIEYLRMMKTIKIRGFRPKTNMHTYRTYAYLIGMLLVRSYDRSLRIQNAMKCRGFQGRFYHLRQYVMKPSDMIFFILMLIILGGIVFMQWTLTLP